MQKCVWLLTKSITEDAASLLEMCQQDMPARYAKVHRRICARHEIASSRMKIFLVLRHTFRHLHLLLALCFHAVAQLSALMTQHSDPLFPWGKVSPATAHAKYMTRVTFFNSYYGRGSPFTVRSGFPSTSCGLERGMQHSRHYSKILMPKNVVLIFILT